MMASVMKAVKGRECESSLGLRQRQRLGNYCLSFSSISTDLEVDAATSLLRAIHWNNGRVIQETAAQAIMMPKLRPTRRRTSGRDKTTVVFRLTVVFCAEYDRPDGMGDVINWEPVAVPEDGG